MAVQLDLSMQMNSSDVFHFDGNKPDFDSMCHENGMTFWYARDLMDMLGYSTYQSFSRAIQKAITTCSTLNIDIMDNFVQVAREINSKEEKDYKLSRFACYLVAINGDTSKPEVARAQAYFAAIAETFKRYIENAEEAERILIRDEVSQHEKSLSAAASSAGVTEYALFRNAGYRGMYNMNFKQLKARKGLAVTDKTPILDFMGKEELAANLFRVTQTEAKLRNEGIKGQSSAERAAEQVGKKVRDTMQQLSGTSPEDLPTERNIRQVRADLKASSKEFQKLDKKK